MRRAAFIGLVAIVAGACSPGGADGPETTVPTSATTVATPAATAVADPFAIPAVIDAAYVDRVLAALNKVDGDLVRDLVAKNTLDSEASVRLRAIYNEPEFEHELQSLVKLFGRGLDRFKRPPGDRTTLVAQLVTTSPTCILAKVVHDYSNVVESSRPQAGDQIAVVTLRPTEAGADPRDLNPTPWSFSNTDLLEPGDEIPERAMCAGA